MSLAVGAAFAAPIVSRAPAGSVVAVDAVGLVPANAGGMDAGCELQLADPACRQVRRRGGLRQCSWVSPIVGSGALLAWGGIWQGVMRVPIGRMGPSSASAEG